MATLDQIAPGTTKFQRLRNGFKSWVWAQWTILIALADAVLTVWASLWFGFTFDDLMNGYWGLTRSWGQLLEDIAEIWRVSPAYRPVGIAILKLFYQTFGLNLFWWRVAYGVLFCAVVVAVILFARRMTGSATAAAGAGLVIAYHPSLRWVYFSIGYIYDIAASLFAIVFYLSYLRVRHGGGTRWAIAAIVSLWLGLAAKESAVAGLVFVLCYEILELRPASLKLRSWWVEHKLLWCSLLIGGAFCAARLWDPNSPIHLANYAIDVSFTNYARHLGAWLSELAGGSKPVAIALLGLAILGFSTSARIALWSILGFLGGILPTAFIPQRGLETVFIPVCGLAILLGLGFARVCELLFRFFRLTAVPNGAAKFAATGLSIGVVLFLQSAPAQRVKGFPFYAGGGAIMPALAALEYFPRPAIGDYLVFESDPFREHAWAARFLFALYFDEPDLKAWRREQLPDWAHGAVAPVWRHVAWNGLQWIEISGFKEGAGSGVAPEARR